MTTPTVGDLQQEANQLVLPFLEASPQHQVAIVLMNEHAHAMHVAVAPKERKRMIERLRAVVQLLEQEERLS